jgi:hypothetical protein
MVPGIQVQTFSSASKQQRKAAKALAEELSKYLANISLSLDSRVTPAAHTDQEQQRALVITIGSLLWGSP